MRNNILASTLAVLAAGLFSAPAPSARTTRQQVKRKPVTPFRSQRSLDEERDAHNARIDAKKAAKRARKGQA